MKKGLMIIAKDVDAYLANHINRNFQDKLDIDIVVLKHRDKLEFENKFADIKYIYSLPAYAFENRVYYDGLSDNKIVEEIDLYSEKYLLRNINRYIHYDFYRGVKKETTWRENYIRVLTILDFFKSVNLTRYDFCFGELSRSFNLICFDIMKFEKKLYLSPANIGALKGLIYVDDKFQIINIESKRKLFSGSKKYQEYIDKAEQHILAFREKPQYNYNFLSMNISNNLKKLKHVFRKSKNLSLEVAAYHIDKKYKFDYVPTNPIARVFKREIYSLVLSKIMNYMYFRKSILKNEKYIFFPLHVHPETTTSLFSEFAMDHVSQHASTIEYLSKSIPNNTKLLVKEHPAMIGNREARYYKYYNQFYNVDFVGPKVSQYDALAQSEYIVTLCGTIGIEALMKKKKVITIGNAYYSYFRGVKHIHCIEDFPKMFQESEEFITNDTLLNEDFAFLMYCTHFGVFNFLIDDDPKAISNENLDLFSESILYELEFEDNH